MHVEGGGPGPRRTSLALLRHLDLIPPTKERLSSDMLERVMKRSQGRWQQGQVGSEGMSGRKLVFVYVSLVLTPDMRYPFAV